MPGTKPIGPGVLYIKAESTAFTYEQFAATDAIRHFGVPKIGGHSREPMDVNISRGDRGKYHQVLGRYNDIEATVEIPYFGVGTAGTALAPRKALIESACGCSETVSGGTSVTYESDVANPAGTVSMYYVDRNAVVGQYLIGFIGTSIGAECDKDNAPKRIISGKAARKQTFWKTTLGAELDAVGGTTSMTLAEDDCILNGDEGIGAITGLNIMVTIGAEHILITAFNRTTKVATISREQLGSSAALHSNASAVTPYAAAPTYAEAGILNGPCDWTATIDGTSYELQKFSYTLETGRAFSPIGSGQCASDSIHNEMISGSGNFSFVLDNTRNTVFYKHETNDELDIAITIGSTAGSIFTENLDHCIVKQAPPYDLGENTVAEVSLDFETRDTATALAGQYQSVET